MKNKEKLSPREWLKRISRAKKFRDQVKEKQNWGRLLDEYKGEYKLNNQAIKSPPINIIYGYVETGIAKIYFRDPYISVNPKGQDFIARAKLLEPTINYIIPEIGLKKEIEKVLKDTFLVGHGWLKYGYINEIGESEGEHAGDKTEFIKNEDIFVTYVPWEDVLFDVTLCKDPPYDCRWIAHRIIRPIDEIKNDPKYKNTSNIKTNVSVRDAKGDKIDETMRDTDLDLFEFWEVWDKESNKIYAVAEGSDKYLREDDNEYEMKGLPFSMLKFNKINGEAYPLSDCFIIEPQVLERIKLRASQLNHVKRWARQISVEVGAMTKEEMEKFSQGVDGAVTQRKLGSNPPIPIQYGPMQEEIFALDTLIQQDMDMVIGQTEVDRGGIAKTKTKTKYELMQQENASNGRQIKRQDMLEDFLEEVAQKIIELLKQFQTTKRYVRMSGLSPQDIAAAFPGTKADATGIYFDKDDIQGDYDVEVKAGSTLPLNKQGRMQTLETIFKIAPAIGITPGSPVSMELGKEFLRELDMKGVEKAYEQQIQMMAQQAMLAQQAQRAQQMRPPVPVQARPVPQPVVRPVQQIPLNPR